MPSFPLSGYPHLLCSERRVEKWEKGEEGKKEGGAEIEGQGQRDF